MLHIQCFKASNDVARVKASAKWSQNAVDLHLRGEVATRIELHDEIEVLLIAEGVVKPRDKRILAFWSRKVSQDILLSKCVVELVICENGALGYRLHGMDARTRCVLDEQYLGVSLVAGRKGNRPHSLAPHILYRARG